MPRNSVIREQITVRLRLTEVAKSSGKSNALACEEACISEETHCRWRKQYAGLQYDQAKHVKELEHENPRLKKIMAKLPSENASFKKAFLFIQRGVSGKFDFVALSMQ